MKNLIALLLVAFANTAQAGEPAYCDLKTFLKSEVSIPSEGLERAHAFQLGSLKLVGLAIGDSKTSKVRNLAATWGDVAPGRQYCTWYLNDGNHEAARYFSWNSIQPNPKRMSPDTAARKFYEALSASFSDSDVSWLSCAEKDRYIAMGCDGMKHRGPGAFGMLLSLSGCRPESSLAIVNYLWKKNGVADQTRLAAIQTAYEFGNRNTSVRARLQRVMK